MRAAAVILLLCLPSLAMALPPPAADALAGRVIERGTRRPLADMVIVFYRDTPDDADRLEIRTGADGELSVPGTAARVSAAMVVRLTAGGHGASSGIASRRT